MGWPDFVLLFYLKDMFSIQPTLPAPQKGKREKREENVTDELLEETTKSGQ